MTYFTWPSIVLVSFTVILSGAMAIPFPRRKIIRFIDWIFEPKEISMTQAGNNSKPTVVKNAPSKEIQQKVEVPVSILLQKEILDWLNKLDTIKTKEQFKKEFETFKAEKRGSVRTALLFSPDEWELNSKEFAWGLQINNNEFKFVNSIGTTNDSSLWKVKEM